MAVQAIECWAAAVAVHKPVISRARNRLPGRPFVTRLAVQAARRATTRVADRVTRTVTVPSAGVATNVVAAAKQVVAVHLAAGAMAGACALIVVGTRNLTIAVRALPVGRWPIPITPSGGRATFSSTTHILWDRTESRILRQNHFESSNSVKGCTRTPVACCVRKHNGGGWLFFAAPDRGDRRFAAQTALAIKVIFCPPKPKLFESTVLQV